MTYANAEPAQLDVVVLLDDHEDLPRGQVGAVVDLLDESTALVEFSDDEGRAYAVVPCDLAKLMVLHYEPQAA